MKLRLTDWGIANRFPDRIEINKGILKTEYHPLFYELIEHEVNHSSGWGTKDFLLDLKGFNHKKLYWKFVLTHPKSWVNFFFLYRSSGTWYFDVSIFIVWMISIIIVMIITYTWII